MSLNITERLSEFIEQCKFQDFSTDVIDAAKESILDFIAVAVAGYRKGHVNKRLMDYFLQIGGKAESSVLGVDKKVPALQAALINGTSGHSLDLDDGHRKALGHPGVCVVPAALALGECTGCSGKHLIVATIAGYEIFIRLGKALNPSHFSRGFHTTGACGTLAAAAAAAKILSLNKNEIVSALGIAGTQSAGLLIVTHSGQMVKPLNAGKAAQNGVLSALLAQAGVCGPVDIIEGKDGFAQAFAGTLDHKPLLEGLGKEFGIAQCYRKLYPACRHSHAAIDAALFIKNMEGVTVENIKKIKVTTYPAALKLTLKDKMPQDEPATRFNLAFAVSLALVKGRAGLDDFSMESVEHRDIQQLFNKVEMVSDPAFESKENNIRGAQVEITRTDNTTVKNKVLLPKGEPENPATAEELEKKFESCVGDFWTAEKRAEVLHCIRNLEKVDDIRKLTEIMRDSE